MWLQNFSNMTRFARAKGSKASNERLPNDPTPWHVMKQQLVENLSTSQGYSGKTKSAKELLCEKQSTSDVTNDKSNWAEFENSYERKNNSEVKKAMKRKSSIVKENQNVSSDKHDESNVKVKKRNIDEVDRSVTEVKDKDKKSNNQYDNKSNKQNKVDELNNQTNIVHDSKNKTKGMLSKRQKRNMKRRQNTGFETRNDNNSESINNMNNDKSEGMGNGQTRRFDKRFGDQSTDFRNGPYKFGMQKLEKNKKKQKPPKIRDDKEHTRRKPDIGYIKLVINGVEVEIVKFDGFPVKKEDADRLHELKQKMIMKGIPEKEINVAMKLERRKAEKALARIKKCVCFHCRKSGHNLSDCPELGSEQAGTGICFKCGSTEHTHFECKVAKPTEFRYATCFICREQGHIAKQCPDNPKGVYPQGGCCKICGDVTHLKKDCPDLIKEREENTVTVTTIADGDIECLEENKKILNENNDNKSKKIVKF
ncbi:GATA zinc finger domain-containing protein 8-like isoform X1 [Osmia bicornis bicornis]|uniref:GATA zinc finger domain-containing protein 8-like isoform X1 n=2 Tax=Osmia bicornis bicornis TaxID=1437191 RepID=UPI001EAF5B5D|nr:GATA zinc finger domain-containing protein 8-like isoform X1 [Osmia bicornis bicornis]